MHRSYDFHLGTNNGNVRTINNCLASDRSQNFDYDSLNRLADAYTTGTSSANTNWGATFSIDPWGNMYSVGPYTGRVNYPSGLTASPTTKNQLTGFGYDIAGNMVSNGSASYVYDAENRMTSTAGMSYRYDGDGARVVKCSGTYPSCSSGTLYWNGTGSTLSETSWTGTITSEYVYFGGKRVARRDGTSNNPSYYFSDHLGSASVVSNASGGNLTWNDYYPYGGVAASGGSDANRYKFNGKERDAESGLDNFGARYDASNIGRFMTPDWAAKPVTVPYANFGNPQSLNLYAYAENNPTTLGDPDGHVADRPLPYNHHAESGIDISSMGRSSPGDVSTDVEEEARGEAIEAQLRDTGNVGFPAQNTAQQQSNRQPDGSYKATPAQLAEIKAADKNGTTITTKADPLGQCVTACERFTGVPGPTSSWRKGTSATDLTDKDIGTAIATFQGSGDKARYKSDAGGHKNSGVYMGTSVGGFWMADQWPGAKPVSIRFVPTTDHNNPDNASMQGSAYSVILVPNP